MSQANQEQQRYWTEQAGPVWVELQDRLDRQIRPHGALALGALELRGGERVLDVGSGCGDTAVELARRVGPEGAVLGVDISQPMLARARERAAGLPQVSFLQADAQTADLPRAGFDAVFSRFGVMFFEKPVAAFRNLRAALRPGGRLAFVCWRPPQENPWITLPMVAVAPLLELPPPPPAGAPGMFAFADGQRVSSLLEEAGFEGVRVEPREVRMAPGGGSLEDAVDTFLRVGPVAAALREAVADPALRQKAAEAVRQAFEGAASQGSSSFELGSAVWLVTARESASDS